jgi:hypothetical protein
MKLKFVASIVAFALALASMPTQAMAAEARNPDVPFPLALEMPFPWGAIEGIWEAQGNGVDALFSFEILQSGPGDRKILKVVHLDPFTGQALAEGAGISFDSDKMVRAAMMGSAGTYMLFIRAFKTKSVRGTKVATVLTIRSFNSANTEEDVHVIVRKISDDPVKSGARSTLY